MVPWLHFTSGDHLFFKSWHPESAGAIAGACIGLVLLALFERWLSATRSVLEAHWRRRYIWPDCVPATSDVSPYPEHSLFCRKSTSETAGVLLHQISPRNAATTKETFRKFQFPEKSRLRRQRDKDSELVSGQCHLSLLLMIFHGV